MTSDSFPPSTPLPTPAPASPARRSGLLKGAAVAAALLLVAVLVLAGVARALLDEETLKRELGAKLGRTVAYASLSPGFFSLSLTDLAVGDTAGFAPDPLLSAPRLSMSYSLLALLTGKLRIETITLSDAVVVIERDTAGRTSIDDLLVPASGDGVVQLESLVLENCRFVLRQPGGEYQLAEVTGALGRLSSTAPSFSLAAKFLDRPLSLTNGSYDIPTGTLALRADLDGLPLETLPVPRDVFDVKGLALNAGMDISASPESAVLKGELSAAGDRIDLDLVLAWSEAITAHGTATANVDVATLRRAAALRAPLDEMAASGRVSASVKLNGPIDRIPLAVNGQFLGLSVKPKGFTARLEDLRGAFRASPEALVLEAVTLTASGMKLAVSGTIGLAAETLDLAVKGDPVNFAGLAGLLDPPVLPAGVRISGGGAVDMRLTGPMKNPQARGTVRLDGVDAQLADPPVQLSDIRGNLQLTGDRVVIPQVDARLKSGTIRASGTYLLGPGSFDMALKADNVDLAELPVTLGVAGMNASGLAGFDGKISGTAAAPRVAGTVTSPSMKFFGVDVSELSGRLLYNADAFTLDDFQARLLGGLIKGDAAATLGDAALPFTANIRADALGLPQLLQAVAGYSGATSGTLGAVIALAGRGSDRGSYTGTATANVTEAGFGSLPALEQLAPFLGLSADKVRSFRSASGSFSIQNGLARLSRPLKLEAAGYSVTADGALGLDGALQLACKADLPSNSVAGRIGGQNIAQVLGVRQAGDRTVVPFTAGGTLFAPRFGLDVKAEDVVGGLMQEGLGRMDGEHADAVRQAAEALFGGQRPATPGSATPGSATPGSATPGAQPSVPTSTDSPAPAQPGAVRSLPQDAVFGILDGVLGRRRTTAPATTTVPPASSATDAAAETDKK